MAAGYLLLGLLCLCYYFLMAFHVKSFRQSFMLFWPAFGLLQFLLAAAAHAAPKWCEYLMLAVNGICVVLFLVAEVFILCGMIAIPPKRLDYLLVLGAKINGTTVSESLRRRLDRAYRYLMENPKTKVIVAGGKGKDEGTTEADAMRRFLIERGVEPERILTEEQSTSTYENLEFAKQLLDCVEDKVGIVTNNFHMYRAMRIGRLLGYRKLFGMSASCNPVMFLNYSVREFFCLILFYVRKR